MQEVKGQLCDIKCEMRMHGVNKDLWTSWLAGGVLGVFERVQGGVDDSGPLLLWGRVCPAKTGQPRWVKEEIGRRHVDFSKLLFQKRQVSLQTYREEGSLIYTPQTNNALDAHSGMNAHKHILTSWWRKATRYHPLQVCTIITHTHIQTLTHTHTISPSVLCSYWSQHPTRHSERKQIILIAILLSDSNWP